MAKSSRSSKKIWGVWIPSLNLWLEDEGRVPYTTLLKREAASVIKQEMVHPKQYEVRQYGIQDAAGRIRCTAPAPS
jgi:hypothetical protein